MIWNEERESLTDAKKKVLQGELLKTLVQRAYDHIPFYIFSQLGNNCIHIFLFS